MLRAIDLCAGAGGLSLGLGWAGFSVYGVEIDPGASLCPDHGISYQESPFVLSVWLAKGAK